MDTPIQVDLGRIAQDLQIRRVQVESVVQLLDEGNTVPFITRYRKERTGNLNEVAIHEIQVRVARLRDLAERKETILKTVEAQGKLTEELAAAIRSADNPKRLEDLYLPFKPKKKTKASEARDKGLEPLALRIWNRDETLTDLNAAAEAFLDPEKGLDTVEKVREGVGHILAEAISEIASVRDAVRRVVWKTAKIVTTKAEVAEGEGLEYRDYFAYSEPIAHIPPHRVLAINRGDKEGPLKVKLEVSRPDLEGAVFGHLPLEGHPHAEFFRDAALDALDRLLLPSMEREVRRDLTEMAERHAVDVFARNLRSLLLQPPIPRQVVLAIDPGFRTGCKVAVLDGLGNLVEHGVIHPHPPQNRRHEAKLYLKDLVGKHEVGVVAIGNGTACRETEELIAEIIAEGTHFHENPSAAAESEAAPTAVASPPESAPAPESEAAPAPAPEAMAPEPGPESAPSEPEPRSSQAEAVADTPTESPEENAEVAPPTTAEMLPPIVGGAPDSETETDPEHGYVDEEAPPEPPSPPATPAEGDSPDIGSPTTESKAGPEQAHGPGERETLPSAPPTVEPEVPTLEREGEASGVAESAAGVTESPPVESASAATTAEETDKAAASSAEAGPTTAEEAVPGEAPAGPVAHPPRTKGTPSGKSDQPRPPRPKAVPPPPRPHPSDARLAQLAYVIVNEAGASVYSASPVGREEFPEFDATLRGTISIGRRLQDPLSELVKIEPQNIGVGLYQHDVNPKQLKESLESVISSCVNFVGVDLNSSSVPLLRHVSGLNQLTARRLVDFRREKGPFTSREQLLQVEGIGPATYTQAAGFLKIADGEHVLDRTWIHPESYPVAIQVLEKLGFTPEVVRNRDELPALHAKLNEADVPALAQELGVGEPTLVDIFEALARPDRDPRDDLPKPIFKKGILKLEDLSPGMELKGTVLNVVDFGAFVDIGLKDSGLVHISQLANRYIKSPHDVVSVGDVVTAWVMGVDQERKRVSLTMVKPGTERPRGGGGPPGGRRSSGEPRESRGGGERRLVSGDRPPRREGSPPSPSQPVGAGAPAGEAPPRRPDRPPGRGPGGPGGRGPGGPQRDSGGPGRGAPRSPAGGSPGRFERAQAPRPPVRPAKPAPPPPPLSKDALTGSVPLRTFGQLKQLWQARVEDSPSDAPPESPTSEAPAPNPETTPPADRESATSEHSSGEGSGGA